MIQVPNLMMPPFLAQNSGSWQCDADMPIRRHVLQQIVNMTALANTARGLPDAEAKIVAVARKLEVMLYCRGWSLEEYSDPSTLARRLQGLVLQSFRDASAGADRWATVSNVRQFGRKRARTDMSSALQIPTQFSKVRKFQNIDFTSRTYKTDCNGSSQECTSLHGSTFMLNNNPALARHIASYLPGVEIGRLALVNKFARCISQQAVESLELDLEQLAHMFDNELPATSLKRFPNLAELRIRHSGAALRHYNDAGLSPSAADDVIQRLAFALCAKSAPNLRTLDLRGVFFNGLCLAGVSALANAIVMGGCPKLVSLKLGGNAIGDIGTAHVAEILASGSTPELRHLDVSENFIGETGIRSLANAVSLGRAPLLETVCLGGNIITDRALDEWTAAIKSRPVKQWKYLSLDNNFVSEAAIIRCKQALEGAQAAVVSRALCSHCPKHVAETIRVGYRKAEISSPDCGTREAAHIFC